MDLKRTSETDKVREALATRISGFPLIAGRAADDSRNTLAFAAGKHSARRFTGAVVTGFGALVIATSAHAGMDMNDSWTGSDKARHQSIGAIAGFAVQQYTGSVWKGIAAGFILGAAKEYADSRNPAAHSVSLQDMLMTTAGAAVGAGFGHLVVRYGQGRTTIQYGTEF